jgi:hypothetical protein
MNLGPTAVWSRTLTDAEALALAAWRSPDAVQRRPRRLLGARDGARRRRLDLEHLLVQGATNPTSAFGNPAIEQIPLSILEAQQGIRPRQRTRSRYIANAAAGAVISDHNFRRV